jgi:hypothetical protein
MYENFSDLTLRCIAVSSHDYLKQHPEMLLYELESIAKIQIRLLQEASVLVRGGIAIGWLVKSWSLVYGQALVDAHQLEENEAKYPRALIQDTLANSLRQLENRPSWSFESSGITGWEGKDCYVDYLRYASTFFKDPDELLNFFSLHARVIQDGLANFNGEAGIRTKFAWLRRYHNSTIRWMGGFPEFEEFVIK